MLNGSSEQENCYNIDASVERALDRSSTDILTDSSSSGDDEVNSQLNPVLSTIRLVTTVRSVTTVMLVSTAMSVTTAMSETAAM